MGQRISLAMRKLAFSCNEITGKNATNAPATILRRWLAMRSVGVHLDIERCEMLAIRTLAEV